MLLRLIVALRLAQRVARADPMTLLVLRGELLLLRLHLDERRLRPLVVLVRRVVPQLVRDRLVRRAAGKDRH